jgi:hypothetical protein
VFRIYLNLVSKKKGMCIISLILYHHHQPINAPTGGAQGFLMGYPQGQRAITHYAGPVRVGSLYMVYISNYFHNYNINMYLGRHSPPSQYLIKQIQFFKKHNNTQCSRSPNIAFIKRWTHVMCVNNTLFKHILI